MAKCKNCIFLEDYWCEQVVDSPDEEMERECVHFEQKTNADRIRAMTDEGLAEWIVATCDTDLEEFCSNPKRTRSCDNKCVLCVMEYLDQPAEEG